MTAWNTGLTDNLPRCVAASDRYFYVNNCRIQDPVSGDWFTCWEISHDGTIMNPIGIGERNSRAASIDVIQADLDCVHNSNLVELCPPLALR